MRSKITALALSLSSTAFVVTAGGGGSSAAQGTTRGAAPAAAPFEPITIPDTIAAPMGATLKFRAHARGAQVYTCTAATTSANGGATTYSWVLKAPDARLYDENNRPLGMHFAGPTWQSVDGSAAVGSKIGQISAPLSGAIPWLQLKVIEQRGSGVFMDVSFVQRLNTTKGLAPTTGCDANRVGTKLPVDYTADYYFYKGGSVASEADVTADWQFKKSPSPARSQRPQSQR